MISKQDILKAAKQIVRQNRGYHSPQLVHPRRDWWIGLSIFATIVIVGSFYLAHLFVQYQAVEDVEGEVVHGVPKYKETVVQDVLTVFGIRSVDYADALSKPAPQPIATTTDEMASTTDAVMGEEGEATTTVGEIEE